jgi:hypothetical protein
MARLTEYGVSVDLPSGWDGRIYTRDVGGQARAAVHAGTFPLPAQRGDFGAGAVETMGGGDVFVVLLEYDPAQTGQPLFQSQSQPSAFSTAAYSPNMLQRAIAGQAGAQAFFAAGGRAFCLYVVLGSFGNREKLAAVANEVISAIRIDG